MSELYKFSAKDIDGNDFSFEELKGKVVLIVNTASKCGFTPQYEGLQKLYEKYKDKGLMILGFPTNDFLFQEPGSNSDIKNFCMLNFGVDFPMFEKIHVRGKSSHPLYNYLVSGAGGSEFKGFIKWNFTKFLFDRHGKIAARFGPTVVPKDIEQKIADIL
jgi:glutathione peroxidase